VPGVGLQAARSRGLRYAGLSLAAAFGAAAVVGDASTASSLHRANRVNVKATLVDFRITFSRSTVPSGLVALEVVNKGAVAHDLVFSKGDRTRVLQPGQKQTITVSFSKSGVYRFYCSVPGHRGLGMAGTVHVGATKAPAKTSPAPSAGGSAQSSANGFTLTPIVSGLGPLTYALSPPGDGSRLMIVQQDGLVLLRKDDVLQERPFLDLRSLVHADGEKGLLSIAFAPDYPTSGLLYAYYNDLNGNVRVAEFSRSSVDADVANAEARELLRIIKPTADHNGGMMQFGPDGFLYIAVGDGGANPPSIPVGVTGQALDDLLGSILRIDPRSSDPYGIPPTNPFRFKPGARPEIVAYGLRNPWRFWIDAQTNTMLIGDVGEGAREEVDRFPLDRLGLDFGWPCKEGTTTPTGIDVPTSCKTASLSPPIYEYAHSSTRCSITGGVVSRDPRLPELGGLYLWSDLCDGQLYAIDPAANAISEQPLGLKVEQPTSFGIDGLGRTYVASYKGTLYRLDPA
jgi:glucose/arabinose dehydrogenase